ncbi:hypothetical protein [Methylobacterium nodulans]|uniref:Uncharacterized protein n=1 Tax=Methylobacterium nodulans (strain LMG 21967 / CNCM I-2342 / ORS 2060) TaxID=460265 RepID=B8IAP0_METNO|nr:hypothetical protein [Methylobacterium nodulans]ACL61085.1 hypothetical protein Mnod_6280 [Methylobacterium nodulans ORS 2060]
MLTVACVVAGPGADPVIHSAMGSALGSVTDPGIDAGIIPLLGLPRPEVKGEAHALRLALIRSHSRHDATALDLDEIADLLRGGEIAPALERIASLRAFAAAAAQGLAPEAQGC